ncbi:DUF4249 domain-containing protein [Bacteroides helcogenes]|uniref:Lipoprotein n=1 Tax=Bacteroides helcogenes (strain ATCC 35417 / DSM 20613 / JCM 6297 / CCUG 15421 / P 36-108) TaxID=693979 RepID=E6SR57_BACT6|nr:DUF4249 domain-containing protein [Bacteroides helcogenes]ADV42061.1 putative lipoprotein [Bacteroides helcogenes P 36-108]MDY5240008.1 DUF4249 domain-containing protein [Bacteroides helcogenes]
MKTQIKLHLIVNIAIAIIYIAITALLAACENEIPYNPGKQKTMLIMNALLNAGSTENYVILNLSEGNNIGRLNEATLTLFVNGRVVETPQAMTPEDIYGKFPEKSNYPPILFKKFRLTTVLHPGDNIRLEATAENETYRVSSEVTVPQALESIKVDTCLAYLRIHNQQELCRQYKITLQDRPDERNHYRLEILNDFKFRYLNEANKERIIFQQMDKLINCEDVILTDGHPSNYDDEDNGMLSTINNKYNIFTDSRFRNSSATLNVYTPHYDDLYPTGISYKQLYRTQTITIRLLSLTEEEYRYLKALNTLEDLGYSVLMEPVRLPSNIQNGLGFVGISAETKIIIKFPEKKL